MVIRRIQKAGGSFYVTLPKKYMGELRLLPGDYVELMLKNKTIHIVVMSRAGRRKKKR